MMRRIITIILLINFVACTSTKKVSNQKAKEVTKKVEEKIVLPEITNLVLNSLDRSAKVTWEFSKKDEEKIDQFEISYSGKALGRKKVKIDKSKREIILEDLEPFDYLLVKIKTMDINKNRSNGISQKVKIEHKNVVEDEFSGKKMHIYLPEGYNESEEKYPVMYMMDGQNLFNKEYVSQDWEIDNILDKLIEENKIEKNYCSWSF